MRENDALRFLNILFDAKNTISFGDDYVYGCIEERNKYMIDNCQKAIFIFDGSEGNTKNALDYAMAKGIEIVLISDFY